MRALVVEGNTVLSAQVSRLLSANGFAVDTVSDGAEALFLGGTEAYDIILLSLGLPTYDGLTVLKKWRSQDMTVPVIILSGRSGLSDKVDGLDVGADDYIVKPYDMVELMARIRANVRRNSGNFSPSFRSGDILFDYRTKSVTRDGAPVGLTSQEAAVLNYLIQHSGRLVSRTELSEHIYSYDDDCDSNTIAVFVARLRKKLGAEVIRTVRGRGYIVDGC